MEMDAQYIEFTKRYLHIGLEWYNNLFGLVILGCATYYIVNFVQAFSDYSTDKRLSHKVALELTAKRVVMQLVVLVFFFCFTDGCLGIGLLKLIRKHNTENLAIGVVLLASVHFTRRTYARLRFDDILDEIHKNDGVYFSAKKRYSDMLIELETSIDIVEKQIDVLKSITPVSVLSVMASAIIKGEGIIINWNIYTLLFLVAILGIVLMSYDKLKTYQSLKLKQKKVKIKLNSFLENMPKRVESEDFI